MDIGARAQAQAGAHWRQGDAATALVIDVDPLTLL